MNKYITYSEEVKNALENNLPIVALESTIISHGMPYPKNLETAKMCEDVIRQNGCVPATIAILNGKLKVGLNVDELEYLAKAKDVIKASRRDIPYIVANSLNGATTVSGTMFVSELAGIKVFATGGIGGVHRDLQEAFDVSNDIESLDKSNVMVVCAGVKSILDIPNTLEFLETKGVPVLGYKTSIMPAFYTKESDYKVNYQVNSPLEVAKIMHAKWELGMNGGVLLANPIKDEDSYDKDEIDQAINQALAEAKAKNIAGKEITPFLLGKIKDITGGASLEANIKLVLNNCDVAAKVAKEFYNL